MSQNAVLLVKVPQAAAMLGISRTKLYELITRKEIDVLELTGVCGYPLIHFRVGLHRKWAKSSKRNGTSLRNVSWLRQPRRKRGTSFTSLIVRSEE